MISALALKKYYQSASLLGVWRSTFSEPILKKVNNEKWFNLKKMLNACIFKRPRLQPAKRASKSQRMPIYFYLSHCCFLVSPGSVSTIPVLVGGDAYRSGSVTWLRTSSSNILREPFPGVLHIDDGPAKCALSRHDVPVQGNHRDDRLPHHKI